jgi:hypothetical protein
VVSSDQRNSCLLLLLKKEGDQGDG